MKYFKFLLNFVIFILFILSPKVYSQIGTVLDFQKISNTSGNFLGQLSNSDYFSRVARIGDLDNNGVIDIAVGAYGDDDGSTNRGAVWILFLNTDGSVLNYQKISATEGGFSGQLSSSDHFGNSISSLGDIDGDGITDIAVGSPMDDDGNTDTGAVWILFLNADGTVKTHQKISKHYGNFMGDIDPHDYFGMSVSNIGDFDNDGIVDLAVGASGDYDGHGERTGALWLLFLNNNGTVKDHAKISATHGNFSGELEAGDRFGRSCSNIGDLDENGVDDIIVGAHFDDDGDSNQGAIWVLFMNMDGTVKSHQKISETQGNFNGDLNYNDQFGISSTSLGDIDSDGITDIMITAHMDNDGGNDRGAVWILFLNNNGTVKNHQKISDLHGSFEGILNNEDLFGATASYIGADHEGNIKVAVGAVYDDDGGSNKGAVWILTIRSFFTSSSLSGALTYFNNGTAMNNVMIDFGGHASVVTDSEGNYGPVNLPIETINLVSSHSKEWAQPNSIDLLILGLYIAYGFPELTPIQLLAADVTNTDGINVLDLLMMKIRIAMNTKPPMWQSADWLYYDTTVDVDGITIHNFEAIMSGDVDGSNIPEY